MVILQEHFSTACLESRICRNVYKANVKSCASEHWPSAMTGLWHHAAGFGAALNFQQAQIWSSFEFSTGRNVFEKPLGVARAGQKFAVSCRVPSPNKQPRKELSCHVYPSVLRHAVVFCQFSSQRSSSRDFAVQMLAYGFSTFRR